MDVTGVNEDQEDKEEASPADTEMASWSVWKQLSPSNLWREGKAQFPMCAGLIVSLLTISSTQFVVVIFAGHLGTIALDVAAVAGTVINVTGLAVLQGLGTACDTCFSQTYGSGNRKHLGIYLQKALLILSLSTLPCIAVQMNAGYLLELIGIDPLVSRLTGHYLIHFFPGLMLSPIYICLAKYMQCQNLIAPVIISNVVGLFIHVISQYILVFVLDLGLLGNVMALNIFCLTAVLWLYGHMVWTGVFKETWAGWKWDCLLEWGEFTKLALYGALMLCCEWFSYEIGVLFAGIMGADQLAAQTVVFNLDLFLHSVPAGVGLVAGIRVGQFLGAGAPQSAVTAVWVSWIYGSVISFFLSILLAVLRYQLPRIMTSDVDVIAITASLLPIVAFYNFFDNMMTIGRYVLRGCGKQGLGSAIVLFSFYVLALPLGITLIFKTQLKMMGFWIGMATALVVGSLAIFIYLMFIGNWNLITLQALMRAGVNDEKATENTGLVDMKLNTEATPNESHTAKNGYRKMYNEDEEENIIISWRRLPCGVLCKRLTVLLGCISLVVASIACRYFSDSRIHIDNVLFYNITALNSYNVSQLIGL